MSMGDKNGIVNPEELPDKNKPVDPEKKAEVNKGMPPPRIVDDKLIGDDRDLQDALERPENQDQDPARENNY